MQNKAELTIVIESEQGIAPINSFVTVLNNTIGVLRDLAEALDGNAEVEWAITKVRCEVRSCLPSLATTKYPKISEAPPMAITGGIDPVDYVRKIRNGEGL